MQQSSATPAVSVIVPTFHEAPNVPGLLARIAAVREDAGLDLEVLFVDDDSGDGIEGAVTDSGFDWARLLVRKGERGLSGAVLAGFEHAHGDTLVVIDGDLSHPPEAIPKLLAELDAGADFVLGSRYAKGGSTDAEWGIYRWLNSKAATLLARPFTRALDPMSGFFAIRREMLDHAPYLNPVGYKIGLEILVKCGCRHVREVPIHFTERQLGQSKLTLLEQLRYLQHIRRLAIFKFAEASHAAQFAAVGASGTLVNLAVLTLLLILGVPLQAAVAVAIGAAMVSNFFLNRRFSFSYARHGSSWRQFIGFCAASSIGAAVNYATTLTLAFTVPALQAWPQIAALAGIASGLLSNYLLSRFAVFRKAR